MQVFWKRYQLWALYAAFMAAATVFGAREGLLTTTGPLPAVKTLIFATYLAFLAYSLLATRNENFFRTLGMMARLWWGRQVGLDLYISMALSLLLIWVIEGSFLMVLVWLVPVVVFANLAVLPFILLNYAEIASRLAAG